MLNLQDLTAKQKEIGFYILAGITGLLTLITLIYQLNAFLTLQPDPINPTNPVTQTTVTTTANTDSHSTNTSSSGKPTKESSTAATSSSDSAKEVATEPTTASPLNLILTAKLDTNEKTEDDTIKTFLVEDPLAKGDFEARIKQITLSKLSKDSMEMVEQKGEGILDVDFTFDNKSKQDAKIYPSLIILDVNEKTQPITLHPDFKDQTIAPGKTAKGSFLVALPELKKIEDVTEFTFTWSTTIGNTTQPYEITVLLKD